MTSPQAMSKVEHRDAIYKLVRQVCLSFRDANDCADKIMALRSQEAPPTAAGELATERDIIFARDSHSWNSSLDELTDEEAAAFNKIIGPDDLAPDAVPGTKQAALISPSGIRRLTRLLSPAPTRTPGELVVDLLPMKDAPRDGTEILAWSEDGNFHQVKWKTHDKWLKPFPPYWGVRWHEEYSQSDGQFLGFIHMPIRKGKATP